MQYSEKDRNLYLLVDIDDLLVKSSDKLQQVLDQKTNFKTNHLRMLEQLNRNCRYFLNQVNNVCEMAKNNGVKPHLDNFPLLASINYDNSEYYTKPIQACKYYLDVANMLLNQFLEERDTFLETDNMVKGETKTFNYKNEMEIIIKYAELISNNKIAFHEINNYCLNEVKRLINEAKEKNTIDSLNIPNYGALVSMDTNDIIKSNSLSTDTNYKKNALYQKPIDDIKNCISLEDKLHDIITNASVFIKPSEEIVDYRKIHSEDNVNWEAVKLIKKLIDLKIFKGVYFSTHHNGNREEKAKIELMQRIIPEASGFIGQRFHDCEHNAIRRGRSSKIDKASRYLMIEPEQIVLLDDSKANCGDCKSKGGTEILYKPATDSEIVKNTLEDTGYNRILTFNDDVVYEFINEALKKQNNNQKIKN